MNNLKEQFPLFIMQGIELIAFSVLPYSDKYPGKNGVEFSVQQELKINVEKKLLIVFTSIVIKDVSKNVSLATFEIACGYELPSFETMMKKDENGNYIIPHDLNTTIGKISLGTSRGIVFTLLKTTALQDIILPVIPFEMQGYGTPEV
jgi:hypothetical protein